MRGPTPPPSDAPWRTLLVVTLLGAGAVVAWRAPTIAAPALLLALVLLLWERARHRRRLLLLAAHLADDRDTVGKLEVRDGPWGELHQAVNRLLQQRRAQGRLLNLMPALPEGAAEELADAVSDDEGRRGRMAVLALGLDGDEPVRAAAFAEAVARQAQARGGLCLWAGAALVVAFGALREAAPAEGVRAALQVARALQAGPPEAPPMAMAVGEARLVRLPGVGLALCGPAVEQALRLQALAPQPHAAGIVCSEEAYLTARHLGGPAAPALVGPAVASPPAWYIITP